MKYVSIDLETTGPDHKKHQIIEFAAVIEDTENRDVVQNLPYFRALVHHSNFVFDLFALELHRKNGLLAELAQKAPFTPSTNAEKQSELVVDSTNTLAVAFNWWLKKYLFGTPEILGMSRVSITAAGKNFASFDLRFLEHTNFLELVSFKHRFLDPSIFFLKHTDESVPGSDECKKRAGIGQSVSHRALDDARDVILMIRAGSTSLK